VEYSKRNQKLSLNEKFSHDRDIMIEKHG